VAFQVTRFLLCSRVIFQIFPCPNQSTQGSMPAQDLVGSRACWIVVLRAGALWTGGRSRTSSPRCSCSSCSSCNTGSSRACRSGCASGRTGDYDCAGGSGRRSSCSRCGSGCPWSCCSRYRSSRPRYRSGRPCRRSGCAGSTSRNTRRDSGG
jgi:hypothetical protein